MAETTSPSSNNGPVAREAKLVPTTRGYEVAAIANVVIGVLAWLIAKALFSAWLYPFAGTLLAWVAAIASLVYFGRMGFRQVPVGFHAPQLIFGKRTQVLYDEGWVWNWPAPFGDLVQVSVQTKPLEINLTEVLTEDQVPVKVEGALQYSVVDPNKFLSAESPLESLRNATEGDIRAIIKRLRSDSVSQETGLVSRSLAKGEGEHGTPLEGQIYDALQFSDELLGLHVSKVYITNIRLPVELEEARTQVQIDTTRQAGERAQAIAEGIEIDNLVNLIGKLEAAGLKPGEAANLVQAERGKARRLIIDGNATPLERAAGALADGVLNQGQPPEASQPPQSGTSKSPRRRGKDNR